MKRVALIMMVMLLGSGCFVGLAALGGCSDRTPNTTHACDVDYPVTEALDPVSETTPAPEIAP